MSEETKIIPTIGRMVYYKFSKDSAEEVNKRRSDTNKNIEKIREDSFGYQTHVGNPVKEGDILPMTITFVHNEDLINGKVFLDGGDDYWATSVSLGSENGQWDWMPYQKGQAKKTKELEKKVDSNRNLCGKKEGESI